MLTTPLLKGNQSLPVSTLKSASDWARDMYKGFLQLKVTAPYFFEGPFLFKEGVSPFLKKEGIPMHPGNLTGPGISLWVAGAMAVVVKVLAVRGAREQLLSLAEQREKITNPPTTPEEKALFNLYLSIPRLKDSECPMTTAAQVIDQRFVEGGFKSMGTQVAVLCVHFLLQDLSHVQNSVQRAFLVLCLPYIYMTQMGFNKAASQQAMSQKFCVEVESFFSQKRDSEASLPRLDLASISSGKLYNEWLYKVSQWLVLLSFASSKWAIPLFLPRFFPGKSKTFMGLVDLPSTEISGDNIGPVALAWLGITAADLVVQVSLMRFGIPSALRLEKAIRYKKALDECDDSVSEQDRDFLLNKLRAFSLEEKQAQSSVAVSSFARGVNSVYNDLSKFAEASHDWPIVAFVVWGFLQNLPAEMMWTLVVGLTILSGGIDIGVEYYGERQVEKKLQSLMFRPDEAACSGRSEALRVESKV